MLFAHTRTEPVDAAHALPGSQTYPYPLATQHVVTGRPLVGPYPAGTQVAIFGLGCFWGAEEIFWQLPGVWVTAVGYAGGYTPHPTYEQVCTGRTGHSEAVLVAFDPAAVSYDDLLARFFEAHDPTQGMRQGNDVGTQYRSAIYLTTGDQRAPAERARDAFGAVLRERGYGEVTTEIAPIDTATQFFFAEDLHQQYLAKN
ncbi:MAG: peptide-methionine (S)-S-oxide reductase MsrA, partial [Jatrophihabitans sp.]